MTVDSSRFCRKSSLFVRAEEPTRGSLREIATFRETDRSPCVRISRAASTTRRTPGNSGARSSRARCGLRSMRAARAQGREYRVHRSRGVTIDAAGQFVRYAARRRVLARRWPERFSFRRTPVKCPVQHLCELCQHLLLPTRMSARSLSTSVAPRESRSNAGISRKSQLHA